MYEYGGAWKALNLHKWLIKLEYLIEVEGVIDNFSFCQVAFFAISSEGKL